MTRNPRPRTRPCALLCHCRGLLFVIAGLDPAIHADSMRAYWVYILASRPRGTLYVGMTNDLVRRVYEHQNGLIDGFTKQYRVKMLVYFERHETPHAAIQREKNVKHWSRKWKLDLIQQANPAWRDLTNDIAR